MFQQNMLIVVGLLVLYGCLDTGAYMGQDVMLNRPYTREDMIRGLQGITVVDVGDPMPTAHLMRYSDEDPFLRIHQSIDSNGVNQEAGLGSSSEGISQAISSTGDIIQNIGGGTTNNVGAEVGSSGGGYSSSYGVGQGSSGSGYLSNSGTELSSSATGYNHFSAATLKSGENGGVLASSNFGRVPGSNGNGNIFGGGLTPGGSGYTSNAGGTLSSSGSGYNQFSGATLGSSGAEFGSGRVPSSGTIHQSAFEGVGTTGNKHTSSAGGLLSSSGSGYNQFPGATLGSRGSGFGSGESIHQSAFGGIGSTGNAHASSAETTLSSAGSGYNHFSGAALGSSGSGFSSGGVGSPIHQSAFGGVASTGNTLTSSAETTLSSTGSGYNHFSGATLGSSGNGFGSVGVASSGIKPQFVPGGVGMYSGYSNGNGYNYGSGKATSGNFGGSQATNAMLGTGYGTGSTNAGMISQSAGIRGTGPDIKQSINENSNFNYNIGYVKPTIPGIAVSPIMPTTGYASSPLIHSITPSQPNPTPPGRFTTGGIQQHTNAFLNKAIPEPSMAAINAQASTSQESIKQAAHLNVIGNQVYREGMKKAFEATQTASALGASMEQQFGQQKHIHQAIGDAHQSGQGGIVQAVGSNDAEDVGRLKSNSEAYAGEFDGKANAVGVAIMDSKNSDDSNASNANLLNQGSLSMDSSIANTNSVAQGNSAMDSNMSGSNSMDRGNLNMDSSISSSDNSISQSSLIDDSRASTSTSQANLELDSNSSNAMNAMNQANAAMDSRTSNTNNMNDRNYATNPLAANLIGNLIGTNPPNVKEGSNPLQNMVNSLTASAAGGISSNMDMANMFASSALANQRTPDSTLKQEGSQMNVGNVSDKKTRVRNVIKGSFNRSDTKKKNIISSFQ